ncbi:MAG TPA: hypothetical protein VFI61_03015 [Patescibacteria group bacterium]|nr:hypothetical protein [Patescibacteria group bacterium]
MSEKITSKQNNWFFRVVLLSALILLGISIIYKSNPKFGTPNVISSTAQILPSDGKGSAMGTASKSWNESSFDLNVTAFLSNPAGGSSYNVYLKGDGADLSDMLVGKMVLSGDVYSLNYNSNKNLFAYKDLFVSLQTDSEATSGKLGKTVLAGSFTK